jgi:hypothetical protein
MLGVDVHALDVVSFTTGARHAFVLLAVLWLALTPKVRRPG